MPATVYDNGGLRNGIRLSIPEFVVSEVLCFVATVLGLLWAPGKNPEFDKDERGAMGECDLRQKTELVIVQIKRRNFQAAAV